MNHKIGVVMGGFLDENDKLMDRSELIKRIKAKDDEISGLKAEIKSLSCSEEKVTQCEALNMKQSIVIENLKKENDKLKDTLVEIRERAIPYCNYIGENVACFADKIVYRCDKSLSNT